MKRFLFLIFLSLTMCNKFCISTVSKVWLERISWMAHEDANEGIPIKVHLIYFYDDEYLKKFSDKSSKEYFESFDEIAHDFGGKIELTEFDIVPGHSQDDIEVLPKKCNAKGALLFARYNTVEKSQKYMIGEDSEVRLVFKKDNIEIIEEKE